MHVHIVTHIQYRKAGMFGKVNVWRSTELKVVGKKSLGNDRFRP